MSFSLNHHSKQDISFLLLENHNKEQSRSNKTTMRFQNFFTSLLLALTSVNVSDGLQLPAKTSSKAVLQQTNQLGRRSLLQGAVLSTILCTPQVSLGASISDGIYRDDLFKFQFKVPEGWTESTQELPDRRKIVLFSKDSTPIMFVAYTPIRDDFTSLGSFGSVDQVASQTILPKGGKNSLMGGDEDVTSSMLSATSVNNAYIFDYIVKAGKVPETHYRSLWTLANKAGNAGSVLVTFTLQIEESKYADMKSTFDDVIGSFGKIKA